LLWEPREVSLIPARALSDDLDRISEAAASFADEGEDLAGILAAEPSPGTRVYLCSYAHGARRAWLALNDNGAPIESRKLVRETVSIAALCELAVEIAGGGRLEELRATLLSLRLTENPPGIGDAEAAALRLETAIGAPPHLATPGYLDAVGAAALELERALGEDGGSPFARAMRDATATVEALTTDVESSYKIELR
jgi:hypothetical protein